MRLEHIPVLCSACHGEGALLGRAQRGQGFSRAVSSTRRHQSIETGLVWKVTVTAMDIRALDQVAVFSFPQVWSTQQPWLSAPRARQALLLGSSAVHVTPAPLNFNPEGE